MKSDLPHPVADMALHRSIIAALVLAFLLQLHLVFVSNINWDEFYFLSHVYDLANGRLFSAFQTFHTQLFIWLTELRIGEVDQIVAARLVMLAMQVGSVTCLFFIAREFFDRRVAMMVVCVYIATAYVVGHGASFRTDPIATFLMTSCVAILLLSSERKIWPPLAGSAAALALLVTVKSIFFAPAVLGALVWRYHREQSVKKMIAYFAVAAIALAIMYAAGWVFHDASIMRSTVVSSTTNQAVSALDKTVLTQSLFPQLPFVLKWLLIGFVPFLLILSGLIIAALQVVRQQDIRAITLLLFAGPLLSVVIYRNAFPYFFPFIALTSALASGLIFEKVRDATIRLGLLFVVFLSVPLQYAMKITGDQNAQRAVSAAVHKMFPAPVPYVDRNGMIPSFEKVGFFMSSWGLEIAAANPNPMLRSAIIEKQPPLLLLNSPVLEAAVQMSSSSTASPLHPNDVATLRENYVTHWGPIWVAGRQLRGGGKVENFELLIGGRYTIECKDIELRLNGKLVQCGDTVNLKPGVQEFWAPKGSNIVLRWGDNLYRPNEPVPTDPIYSEL